MRLKLLCVILLVPAIAAAAGVYFDGGIANFSDLVTRVRYGPFTFKESEPLGTSYWIGGGAAIPVWRYSGTVTPVLELTTDAGYGSKTKEAENEYLEGVEISWALFAVRESIIFGVVAGPGKPFVGFGGGLAVVPWTVTDIESGAELDSHTEVKPAFGIPFGIEFNVSPSVAVGFRGEYVIITGDTTPEVEVEGVNTEIPNALLLGGTARLNF